MAKPRKAQSPYQKYGKRPYRYSESYQQWHRAILDNDFDEAARLGRRHSRTFGMSPLKANGRPAHA